LGTGVIDFEYPRGGSILFLNLVYLIICSVLLPTIDRLIVVGRFLILLGIFCTSLVKLGLESSFLSSISLMR
jgi:hypothetical protein